MSRRNRREKRREARRSLPLHSLHNLLLEPSVRNLYFFQNENYKNNKRRFETKHVSVRSRGIFTNPVRRIDRRSSKLESRRGFSLPRVRSILETRPVLNEFRVGSTCERRKARKEVLHATGKAGRIGQRAPRYTRESLIRCKKG